MSLYKDASLVMIPSAYKDGKLYSIRPTDGSGDFTFSRGSNLAATRVDVNGLIEKGRENLLLQSNQFDTTWTTSSASVTSGQSGYDGSNDAWLLTATNTFNRVQQSISVSGVKRFSVYAKANTNDYLLLGSFEGAHFYATFNLATGAVDSNNINAISPSIEDVGNGWYRCSATWVGTTTEVRIGTQDASGQGAWASTTSGSIYIQDAQLEQGLVATDYIETGASTAQAGILEDMPRLDYSGGASCPALLLEPQRTNALVHSEYFPSWNQNEVTLYGGYSAPDGTNSAYKVTKDGTQSYLLIAGNSTSSDARSIYARTTSGTGQVNLTSHNSNTNSLFTITEEWQRFDVTSTPNISINYYAVDFRGGDLDEIIIWGAQQEVGSYPTSYIPTYGTSQTRSADNPIISSAGDIIDINQGTLFLDGTIDSNVDTEIYFMKFDGVNFNDTLYLYRSAIGKIQGVYRIGGSAYNEETTGAISGRFKAAFAYDSNNDCTLYVNGSKVGASFSIPTPSVNLTAIRLGGFNDTLAKQSGLTHQSLYFPTALTDSECIALTTL